MFRGCRIFLGLALFLSLYSAAQADGTFLPKSRHHQFQTYGLFFDQQSTLVMRQEGRAWGALASSIAMYEFTDWAYRPELVIHGSANASFKFNNVGDTLLTETIDARVGLALDFEFSSSLRGAIIWTHQSGHIADNVPDVSLIGSNLGNEIIAFRVIKDIDQTFRIGGSFRPVVGADPAMVVFGAEQFAEWFFTHQSDQPHALSPYVAVGVEEYGHNFIQATTHIQLGLQAGSHFLEEKNSALRIVLGFYSGHDPRLKYFQFMNSRVDYFYGGLMFDI